MIDFTHTKRPEFIQLVLLIAVVCLALGAITPSASAIEYDDISYHSGGTGVEVSGTIDSYDYQIHTFPNVFPDGLSLGYRLRIHAPPDIYSGYYGSLTDIIDNPGIYTNLPYSSVTANYFYTFWVNVDRELTPSQADVYVRLIADFIDTNTDFSASAFYVFTNIGNGSSYVLLWAPSGSSPIQKYLSYSYVPFTTDSLDLSLTAFAPDDPSGMYVLSLDGSLLDTTYTVGINRYTSEFTYLIDSYAYTDGSGSYMFTGSRNLTLPIFYNSFTNMPYSYEVSVNVNDENGYLNERYLVYWSDLGGLYDTVPKPLVPTPTPTVTFVPPGLPDIPDIIPDPVGLNETVNFTGWYQDQGFEGNNITAPIYSGLRGWFNDNMIPVFEFFLMPIGSLSSMITESASTSTDAVSDSVEQLSSYAAPMVMVGGYVVQLVPNIVWVVVFAALSIGYVVLLIRISTGSIRDTIGRFLGRW